MRCGTGQTEHLSLSARVLCYKHRLARAKSPIMQGLAVRDDRDPVQAVAERLRRACPKIDKIVLFGSRARGDTRPRADIDVAVSCPRASQREWLDLCDAIEDVPTLLSIDLVRLETAGTQLRDRILREGRTLYERGSDQARD